MSVTAVDPTPVASGSPKRRLRKAFAKPGGVFGAAWLGVLILASLTAKLWLPYGIDDQDLNATLAGPSSHHWLGTDDLGRDLLSRIFSAGAPTLLGGLLTVVVAFGIGTPLALLAAEHGPKVERWTSRVAEVFLALPGTVVLLAVVGVVGVNIYPIMAILGLMISAAVYRVLLAVAQSVRQRLYVDAARVNGLGSFTVNARHVLPGMATTVAVQAAQLFGIGVLIYAGLAFLGFGPPSPAPSWGGMINTASQKVYEDPWMMIPTGVVLALTVIAANELADAIAGPKRTAVTPARMRRKPRALAMSTVDPPALVAADPDAVLDVRNLSVAVDGGPALVTDVSFSLAAGRVLGLVGESGCGKTMTARSLLGLLPAGVAVTGGQIVWQGTDLATRSESELRAIRGREIALISQEPMVALDPMFSVASQLIQPIRRFRGVGRSEARRIAAELLQQVGIVNAGRVLKSFPHQLSGGMAQRVCIALALTGKPKLLVADEPTTALDVTVQAEILSLLRALVRDTGLSVVIVSHDLGVVADICDDVAVMYAGQVVESGSATQVLDHPAHPYTSALLGANPHVPEGRPVPLRLASIPGTVPAPKDWPVGCRFASRCPFETDEAHAPVPLTLAHGTGTVRCLRAHEVQQGSLSWTEERVS